MQGIYKYHLDRGEWIGVISDGDTVLDIGCELTEAAIKKWIDAAMRNQSWIEGNPKTPDMYDRRTVN